MSQDELYERLHVASAVLGVLVHELRNPLHGATLLIEAMGLEGADLPSMRAKLRGQIRKFEALLAEVSGPVKDLSTEPRIEWTPLGSVLLQAADTVERAGDIDHVRIDLGQATDLCAHTDRVILARALVELCIALGSIPGAAPQASRGIVSLTLEQADEHIRILAQKDGPPLPEETRKSPFKLAGGGIHFALARALAESIGARVRLDSSDESGTRFALTLGEV
jgi:signal transduction histidine kinase